MKLNCGDDALSTSHSEHAYDPYRSFYSIRRRYYSKPGPMPVVGFLVRRPTPSVFMVFSVAVACVHHGAWDQLSNLALMRTHKTGSTTLATLLYRYGRRHGLEVRNGALSARIKCLIPSPPHGRSSRRASIPNPSSDRSSGTGHIVS